MRLSEMSSGLWEMLENKSFLFVLIFGSSLVVIVLLAWGIDIITDRLALKNRLALNDENDKYIKFWDGVQSFLFNLVLFGMVLLMSLGIVIANG